MVPHASAQTQPSPGERVNAARALISQEKFVAALSRLNDAIKAQPDYPTAYHERARVLFHLGRYADALKDFDRIVRLRPRAPAAYYHRGIVLFHLPTPDYERAIADFDKVIELNPKPATSGFDMVHDAREKRDLALLRLGRS